MAAAAKINAELGWRVLMHNLFTAAPAHLQATRRAAGGMRALRRGRSR